MNTLFKNKEYEKVAKILAEVYLKNDIDKPQAPSFINKSQKAEFEACVETWKTINKMQEIQQFDTDNAWNKLHQRISDKELFQPKNQSNKLISIKQWISIAAGIVLLIGITSLWFWQHSINQTILVANNLAEPKKVELPDGSNVYLNKDAQISYNFSNNQGQRSIILNGEAFFEVVLNPHRPFIVKCNPCSVKVLGTSFNINSLNNFTEVIVATGRVEFYENKSNSEVVILLPGEKGSLIDGNLSKVTNDNQNFLSWMDHKLVFKSMPLSQVISDINHSFHCKIEIGDTSINNLLITTTFNNIPLSGIIESITLAFDLKLVKQTETNYLLLK